MKRPLLIATTNTQKYQEILYFLGDLPFEFLHLDDLQKSIEQPEEIEQTIEKNAVLKARYYAEKVGYLTLADDTGLFVDALDGWPGVHSARFLPTAEERRNLVLEKMTDIPNEKRGAAFRCALALVDPDNDSCYITIGEDRGEITRAPVVTEKEAVRFDTIFFIPEIQKTYSELSLEQKTDRGSHRGKALMKMKYHLMKDYGPRHIVAPLGIIVQNGKVLLGLRNDPFRPTFHRKWEFPGGAIEFGETIEDNLRREIEEETGYLTEVVVSLHSTFVYPFEEGNWKYQVYLMPYVCRIVGGEARPRDAEILELQWYAFDQVLDQELIGKNREVYAAILDQVKVIAQKHNL